MEDRIKYLLLRTVQDDNILPLTSTCNMNCLFCSHRHNPPDLQVYRFGPLSLELLQELMDYLSPGEPVIIGESATRIIEGEPLLHPQFRTVMELFRSRWPGKVIRLTTNGSLLSREMAAFFGRITPLELNISVNCADPGERSFLMGDRQPEAVFTGLKYLKEEGLTFNGSLVAVPHLLGPDSLERTLNRLADLEPETVRIFFPGFTRYAAEGLQFEPEDFYRQLREQVEGLRASFEFPLILEPPDLSDFTCRIGGIIKGSPAAALPLQRGDIIQKVDDRQIETRVDCFQRLLAAADPLLEVQDRGGKKYSILLKKESGERPGIVLDYDLDPGVITQISSALQKYGPAAPGSKSKQGNGEKIAQVVLVTSTLAEGLIKSLAGRLKREFPANRFAVLTVKNNYFGGSIGAAGLLTNRDIAAAFKGRPELNPGLIFLPGIIYDIFGKDLTGEDYQSLTSNLQGKAIII